MEGRQVVLQGLEMEHPAVLVEEVGVSEVTAPEELVIHQPHLLRVAMERHQLLVKEVTVVMAQKQLLIMVVVVVEVQEAQEQQLQAALGVMEVLGRHQPLAAHH